MSPAAFDQRIWSEYISGRGVWAGLQPVGEHAWVYAEPANNFYRLSAQAGSGAADYILVPPGIWAAGKFDPVLLKEWFYTLKVQGRVIIATDDRGVQRVKACLDPFFPAGGMVLQQVVPWAGGQRCVVVKRHAALAPNDSIDAWTFGIITNGKRNEAMEEIVRSIHALRIPQYEIIVCGTYFDRQEPGFSYIHFNEKDEKGWITRKKNLICAAARYQNLVIVHDRLVFDPGWYDGMRRFGNCFDALSCVQVLNSGLRVCDWYTAPPGLQAPPERNPFLRSASGKGVPRVEMGLHYDDWDPGVVMNGGLTILKKSLWQAAPWDEQRFWNDAEDVDISHRITGLGGVIRFNPYSRCVSLYWRHCLQSLARRDAQTLGADFEPDPWPYVWYNARYYAGLRFRHWKQGLKKKLKGR